MRHRARRHCAEGPDGAALADRASVADPAPPVVVGQRVGPHDALARVRVDAPTALQPDDDAHAGELVRNGISDPILAPLVRRLPRQPSPRPSPISQRSLRRSPGRGIVRTYVFVGVVDAHETGAGVMPAIIAPEHVRAPGRPGLSSRAPGDELAVGVGERRVAADELAFARGGVALGDRAQGAAEGKPNQFALQAKALGDDRARTGPAAPKPEAVNGQAVRGQPVGLPCGGEGARRQPAATATSELDGTTAPHGDRDRRVYRRSQSSWATQESTPHVRLAGQSHLTPERGCGDLPIRAVMLRAASPIAAVRPESPLVSRSPNGFVRASPRPCLRRCGSGSPSTRSVATRTGARWSV